MASKTPRWLRRSRRRIGSWLMPQVAPFVLRRLSGSWRTELEGEEHYAATRDHKGCLLTIWHGRMVLGLPHHARRDFTVLVSPSKDGDLMDTLLPRFGYGVIRGSSTRTGARALREMLRSLRVGGTVVVTPDGPRGPRHSGSAGVAWLARATGYPILPLGLAAEPAWRLKSWDAFTLPKWGARVALVYGEPIFVPREADEDTLKRAAATMRTATLAAEARAFERLGVAPDWPDEDLARLDAIRAWRPGLEPVFDDGAAVEEQRGSATSGANQTGGDGDGPADGDASEQRGGRAGEDDATAGATGKIMVAATVDAGEGAAEDVTAEATGKVTDDATDEATGDATDDATGDATDDTKRPRP